jgi:AcrR family transcriptional regulator
MMTVDSTGGDPRDDEILRAAFDLFTERGYDGTTMLSVARRAKASKATLYARFGNKEGLFRALVEWGCGRTLVDLRSIVADDSRDPKEALAEAAVRLSMGMGSAGALALLRVTVAEATRQPEIGRIYAGLTRDPFVEMLRILVERLVRNGDIAPGDAGAFGGSFIGMLRGDHFYQALLGITPPVDPADLERLARQVVARLLRAFAP